MVEAGLRLLALAQRAVAFRNFSLQLTRPVLLGLTARVLFLERALLRVFFLQSADDVAADAAGRPVRIASLIEAQPDPKYLTCS